MIKKILIFIFLAIPVLAVDYYGIEVDEQYLYLCQPESKSIKIISHQDKQEILLNNTSGFDLQAPVSLTVVGDRLFVLDALAGKIIEYQKNTSGFNFVKSHLSGLTNARDLEAWQGKLFILDSAKSRILTFDPTSQKETVLTDKVELDGAYGLAIDYEGFIYVADTFRHRIIKLDAKGNFLNFLGTGLIEQQKIKYPRDITVGFGNNLYVADSGNNRLVVINKLNSTINQVLKNDFEKVLRNICLDKKSAELFYCCGDQFDFISLSFPRVNFEIINNNLNPENKSSQQSLASVKSDSSLICIAQIIDDKRVLLSEKINYSPGINLLNLKQIKLKDDLYKLRVMFFDENSLEAAVFIEDVFVDSQPPQIIEYRISPDVQTLIAKNDPLFVEIQSSEPSYLLINLNDQKGFIVDSYRSLLPKKDFLEKWQISPELYQQLEGDYQIDFEVMDRAGNKNKFFSEKITIKKDHLLASNIELEKLIYQQKDLLKLNIDLVVTAHVDIAISPQKNSSRVKSIFQANFSKGKQFINVALPQEQGINLLTIKITDYQGRTDCFYKLIEIDNLNPKKALIDLESTVAYYGDLSLISFQATYAEDVDLNISCQGKLIWSNKVNANRPQKIIWDAKLAGQALKPGTYALILQATDQAGNISQQKVEFKVVAYAPIVEQIKTDRQVLVKNGYPGFDTINFQYFIDPMSGPVFVDLQIIKNGQVIAVPLAGYKRSPGLGLASFNVNQQKDLEDGVYNYLFKVTNSQGITNVQNGRFFVVTKAPIFQTFSYNVSAISPADYDDKQDKVKFLIQPYSSVFYEFVDKVQIKQMLLKVEITGDNFKQQKVIEINSGLQSFSWDGISNNGISLKDGDYLIKFWLIDQGGLISQVYQANIKIDNSSGRILNINNNLLNSEFNPTQQDLKFNISLKYLNIDQKILATLKDDQGDIIKIWPELEFSGSANYSISWDGKDMNNNFVNDGQYYLTIKLVDAAGNELNYDHNLFSNFAINYSDQKLIRPANGENIISPSVMVNALSDLEYSYAKGFHEQIIRDSSTVGHPAGEAHYFVIDHFNVLEGSHFKKSRSRLIAYLYPTFPNQSSYTLEKNSPKQYHSMMTFLPGVYAFQLDNITNWGSAWFVFFGMDVWYKSRLGEEQQVDPLPLDLAGAAALKRKQYLDNIRTVADSANFSHKVSCIDNNIYYKRSKAVGSAQATAWIQISQTGKICSEPSLTVLPGTDDLEICWLQKDSAASAPYLVSQCLPKNFRPVFQDQHQSLFAAGKLKNITSLDHKLTSQSNFNLDYHISYPNPFYDEVTIRYQLSGDADVEISIIDITGKIVAAMDFKAGMEGGKKSSLLDKYNDIKWNGKDFNNNELIAGVYLYVIDAKDRNGKRIVKKGKLIKWGK